MGRAVESSDSEARQVENIGMHRFNLTRLTFLPALPGKPKSFHKRDRLAEIAIRRWPRTACPIVL